MDRRCVAATPRRGRRRGLVRPEPGEQPGIRAEKDVIRASWERASRARGWRLPDDWWAPSIEVVLDAVADGANLIEPCAQLSAARAAAGVGLAESHDDLWALFSVLQRLPPPSVVRRFAESYAESVPGRELCTDSVDPLTGFARLGYLRARVAEVYREAAAVGVPVHHRHGLLSVRFDTFPAGWLATSAQLASSRVLLATFCRGETVAWVRPALVAVLLSSGISAVPADLSAELGHAARNDVIVRRIRLPATLPGALMQLDVLAESDRPESPSKRGENHE